MIVAISSSCASTALLPRGSCPRTAPSGARRKAMLTADGSAPDGAAPFAATRGSWDSPCIPAASGSRTSLCAANEALHLDRSDVDLDDGVLHIRRTKFGKSRLVPIHPTTQEALRAYGEARDRIISKPHLNGKVERSHRVDDQEFYQLLDKDGITDDIHLFNEKLRECGQFGCVSCAGVTSSTGLNRSCHLGASGGPLWRRRA